MIRIKRDKREEYIEFNNDTFKGYCCLKIQTYEDGKNWGNVLSYKDWWKLLQIDSCVFEELCKKHNYVLDYIYHEIPLFKSQKQAEEMIEDLIPYIMILNLK